MNNLKGECLQRRNQKLRSKSDEGIYFKYDNSISESSL